MADDIITSQGQLYNRTTGRWLGKATDSDGDLIPVPIGASAKPDASTMDKEALVDIARAIELVGFSQMSKAELVTALVEAGYVTDNAE